MFHRFFSRYFQHLLVLGIILGLVLPIDFTRFSVVMAPMLGVIVFASSFKADVHDFVRTSYGQVIAFVIVRFVVLPVAFWAIVAPFSPLLAAGVLLVALTPTGVASLGVASVSGGNVGTSIAILLVLSLTAPFLVPSVMRIVLQRTIEFDVIGLFRTLFFTVFIPLVLTIPVRRVRPVSNWLRENGPEIASPLVAVLTTLGVGHQRAAILENPVQIVIPALLGVALYTVHYLVGWHFPGSRTREARTSLSVASGVNNLTIAIVVGVLYFPPPVLLFAVACEFAWVFGIVGFRRLTSLRSRPPVDSIS